MLTKENVEEELFTFQVKVPLKDDLKNTQPFDEKLPSLLITVTILQYLGRKDVVYDLLQQLSHKSRAYLASQFTILHNALIGYPKLGGISYAITIGKLKEFEDLEAGIKKEFPYGTIGDWDDLRNAESSASELKAFLKAIGLKNIGDTVHLLRGGSRNYSSWRWYTMTRFDGDKPGNYLAHENLNSDTLCLGSWYGDPIQTLVAFKKKS